VGAALDETASEGSTVLVAGARLEERDPGRAARAAAGLRALGDVRGALAATGEAMRRTMAGGGGVSVADLRAAARRMLTVALNWDNLTPARRPYGEEPAELAAAVEVAGYTRWRPAWPGGVAIGDPGGRLSRVSAAGVAEGHADRCALCAAARAAGGGATDPRCSVNVVLSGLADGFALNVGAPSVEQHCRVCRRCSSRERAAETAAGCPEFRALAAVAADPSRIYDTSSSTPRLRLDASDTTEAAQAAFVVETLADWESKGVLRRHSADEALDPRCVRLIHGLNVATRAKRHYGPRLTAAAEAWDAHGGRGGMDEMWAAAEEEGAATAAAYEAACDEAARGAERGRGPDCASIYDATEAAGDGAGKLRVTVRMDVGLNVLLPNAGIEYASVGEYAGCLQTGDVQDSRDATMAYNQVPLHPAFRPLTGVRCPVTGDVLTYTALPMGMKPSCIQYQAVAAEERAILHETFALSSAVVGTGILDDTLFAGKESAMAAFTRHADAVNVRDCHAMSKRQHGRVVEHRGYRIGTEGRVTVVLKGAKLADLLRKLATWAAIARGRWPFPSRAGAERLIGDLGWLASVDAMVRLHLRGAYRALVMAEEGGFSSVCLRAGQPMRGDLDWLIARARAGGLRGMRFVAGAAVGAIVVHASTYGAPVHPDEARLQARICEADGIVGMACDASVAADGRRGWALLMGGRTERKEEPRGTPLGDAWADELELAPILHMARTRREATRGRLVVVLTDSASNAYRINKMAARYGSLALTMLQEIFSILEADATELLALWLPRCANGEADAAAD